MNYKIKGRKIILSDAPICDIHDGIQITLKPHWGDDYNQPTIKTNLLKGVREYDLMRGVTQRDIVKIEAVEARIIQVKYTK